MALNIDNRGPAPIHQQITDWMRQQILSGQWPEDYKLKSESDWVDELDVSRGTIRKAIQTLIDEGLIVRIHGRGTFVKTNLRLEQRPLGRLAGFSRDLISRGIPYSTEVLINEVVPPKKEIAEALYLQPNDRIFHLQRLRRVQNRPVLTIMNHIVYEYCQGVDHYDFTKRQLYKTLEDEYRFNLDWARRTYRAVVANKEIARLLEIESGAPLMYIEELYHLKGDIPVEYTKVWINAEVFEISTIIKREDEKRDFEVYNE